MEQLSDTRFSLTSGERRWFVFNQDFEYNSSNPYHQLRSFHVVSDITSVKPSDSNRKYLILIATREENVMKIDMSKYKDVPVPLFIPYAEQFVDLSRLPKWDIPDKVIVKAAVNGAMLSKENNPNLPITIDEIKSATDDCIDAGVSGVHIHVRDEDGLPTGDIGLLNTIVNPIRKRVGMDVVIDGCTVFGDRFEDVMEPLAEGLFEVSPVNTCAIYTDQVIFANPIPSMKAHTEIAQELNIKPQIAVYNMGDIDVCKRNLIDTGILKKPYYWIIVIGLSGWSPLPNPLVMFETLAMYKRLIDDIDPESVIMVCASGRATGYLSTAAMLLGMHVRVGMEDSIWVQPHKDDIISSNKETVKSTIRIAHELGREVATADEYRDMVGIKRSTSSKNFEQQAA